MVRFVAENELEAGENDSEDDTLRLEQIVQIGLVIAGNILKVVSSQYEGHSRADWHRDGQERGRQRPFLVREPLVHHNDLRVENERRSAGLQDRAQEHGPEPATGDGDHPEHGAEVLQ